MVTAWPARAGAVLAVVVVSLSALILAALMLMLVMVAFPAEVWVALGSGLVDGCGFALPG